jgi:DedD protein
VKPELSAAELELKRRGRRRLIGAVTMGIVAIVVLPMIFDSEPKRKDASRQEIEIQIPPKEGLAPLPTPVAPPTTAAEVTPKETPKADGKLATDVQAPKTVVAPPAPAKPVVAAVEPVEAKIDSKASAKVAAKTEAPVAAKAESKTEKKTDAKTAEVAPAKAVGGFVIQIGAFKDAENAKSIVTRMKEAKLPVFTDSVAVKTGTVTRVRVGPFPTKEKAESALAEVKLAGVDGKVVPSP